MPDAPAESPDAVAGFAADCLLATERGEGRSGRRVGSEDRVTRLGRGRIGRGSAVDPLLTADVIGVGRRPEDAIVGGRKRRRLLELMVVVKIVDGGMNGVFLNLESVDRER